MACTGCGNSGKPVRVARSSKKDRVVVTRITAQKVPRKAPVNVYKVKRRVGVRQGRG